MRYVLIFCCMLGGSTLALGQSILDSEPVSQLVNTSKSGVAASNSNSNTVEAASVPFILKGGLILMEASLEGQRANYILDTGAPSLFINSNQINEDSSNIQAIGISGLTNIEKVITPTIGIANLVQENIVGYKIDINHLEKVRNCKLGGIIGQEVIKNYELFVDYENKLVKLLDPNNSNLEESMRMLTRIPFDQDGHFVVVEVMIGNKKYRLGIDTGSEANVLDKRLKRKLKRQYKRKEYIKTMGIDKSNGSALKCKLKKMSVAGEDFIGEDFLFSDLSFLNNGYKSKLDGLLGFPFLKERPFSINYQDKHLYFWEYIPRPASNEEVILTKDR